MQGKKLLASISGWMALSFALPASAIMSIPDGWYLEANLGSTHVSNSGYPGSISTSGIGGNADLGYKFMPYIAAEMGYTRYANSSIKDQFGNKAAWVLLYSYDLAARGILPIVDSGFEFFAKLGVERANAHVNIQNATAAANIGIGSSQHSATGLYLGVGAQYYITPEFSLNVQWARANGNNSTGTLDLFSGGATFIFD